VIENSEIEIAYRSAINFTKSHYENFPVLSVFVPKYLQKHVAIVYQFARQADDIADEGNVTALERIEKLNEYEKALDDSLRGIYRNQFWIGLANTVHNQELTSLNFKKLLIAFRQDTTKKEYETLDELLNYCANSANPVGRIILELYQIKDDRANYYSDKICTALQLTNFLQDVSTDYEKGRIYLPQEYINKHNVDVSIFKTKKMGTSFQTLIRDEVQKVRELFCEGEKLLPHLPFRLKQQIKWTIRGGIGILTKIENIHYDVLNHRPTFSKIDLVKLLFNLNVC